MMARLREMLDSGPAAAAAGSPHPRVAHWRGRSCLRDGGRCCTSTACRPGAPRPWWRSRPGACAGAGARPGPARHARPRGARRAAAVGGDRPVQHDLRAGCGHRLARQHGRAEAARDARHPRSGRGSVRGAVPGACRVPRSPVAAARPAVRRPDLVDLRNAGHRGHARRAARRAPALSHRGPLARLRAADGARLLFLFFPRVQGQIWALPSSGSAVTGLSNEMSPGAISELSESEDPAFRARFIGTPPRPDQLYWRGPVLHDFDGYTWRREPGLIRRQNPLSYLGPAYRYRITLEPHQQNWWFALDMPTGVAQSGVFFTYDYDLIAAQPVTQPTSYELVSHTSWRVTQPLSTAERRQALQLPPGRNPRSARAGARRCARSTPDDARSWRGPARAVPRRRFHLHADAAAPVPRLGRRFPLRHPAGLLRPLRLGVRHAGARRRRAGARGHRLPGRRVESDRRIPDRSTVRRTCLGGDLAGRTRLGRVDPTGVVAPERLDRGFFETLPGGISATNRMLREIGWLADARLAWDTLNTWWKDQVHRVRPARAAALLSRLGFDVPRGRAARPAAGRRVGRLARLDRPALRPRASTPRHATRWARLPSPVASGWRAAAVARAPHEGPLDYAASPRRRSARTSARASHAPAGSVRPSALRPAMHGADAVARLRERRAPCRTARTAACRGRRRSAAGGTTMGATALWSQFTRGDAGRQGARAAAGAPISFWNSTRSASSRDRRRRPGSTAGPVRRVGARRGRRARPPAADAGMAYIEPPSSAACWRRASPSTGACRPRCAPNWSAASAPGWRACRVRALRRAGRSAPRCIDAGSPRAAPACVVALGLARGCAFSTPVAWRDARTPTNSASRSRTSSSSIGCNGLVVEDSMRLASATVATDRIAAARGATSTRPLPWRDAVVPVNSGSRTPTRTGALTRRRHSKNARRCPARPSTRTGSCCRWPDVEEAARATTATTS